MTYEEISAKQAIELLKSAEEWIVEEFDAFSEVVAEITLKESEEILKNAQNEIVEASSINQ